jgi:hypothetical protein
MSRSFPILAIAMAMALGACNDSGKIEVTVTERRDDNYFQKPGCEVKLAVKNNESEELRTIEFVLTAGQGRTSAIGSSIRVSAGSQGRASAYFSDTTCAALPSRLGIEVRRCTLADSRNCIEAVALRS